MFPPKGEKSKLFLFDVATRKPVKTTVLGGKSTVSKPAFSPDGKTLATGGHGKVLLWDLTTPPGQGAAAR